MLLEGRNKGVMKIGYDTRGRDCGGGLPVICAQHTHWPYTPRPNFSRFSADN